ncbi:hypothetical protein VPH35_057965 [Triticum aestivum]
MAWLGAYVRLSAERWTASARCWTLAQAMTGRRRYGPWFGGGDSDLVGRVGLIAYYVAATSYGVMTDWSPKDQECSTLKIEWLTAAEGMEQMSQPVATLPEELLMEILARVPYRSLCRFRCVSPSWRTLCSNRGLLRRSPQTLAGFFCGTSQNICHLLFLNFPAGRSGQQPLVDPSLPYLHGGGYTHCCGGLLLCKCFTSSPPGVDYVVCNPATEDWTVLPHTEELRPENIILLGFDPADPSCFVAFVIVLDDDNAGEITGVEIYLSETRIWTSKQTGWAQETRVHHYQALNSLFMNGTLHLITKDSSIVTVDTGGKTWRKISRAYPGWECIGQSRRCLHVVDIDHYNDDGFLLSVWVLEDASGNWTLKHTVNLSELI